MATPVSLTPPKLKPYTMSKFGKVFGIAYTEAIVYTYVPGSGYLPMPFQEYWNGTGWTRTTSAIQGLLGDLYLWRYRPTITAEKIIYKRNKSGNFIDESRFYDDSLREMLGGERQTLG